jgi:hypothetical protein
VGIVPDYAVEPRDRLRVRPIEGASPRELAVAWRGDLAPTGALSDLLAEVRAAATRPASPARAGSRR